MCGIIGVIGSKRASEDLAFGLSMQQHRGQDAAGILTFSQKFHLKKSCGLVASVFNDEEVAQLEGNIGIGHVRYATQGGTDASEAQPFYVNFPFGIGMVHNGNLTNAASLVHRCGVESQNVIQSQNDLELLLYVLATELTKEQRKSHSIDALFSAVHSTQNIVAGAYAALAVIPSYGLLGFCDPHRIRPLVLGARKNLDGSTTHAFMSESSALEIIGFDVVRELEPGEAILVDFEGRVHSRSLRKLERKFCVFEYIYFSREDSAFFGHQVAAMRGIMGKALAKRFIELNLTPDVVIDVPSSAWFFAEALGAELGVPCRKGFVKNKYAGRSFIMSSPALRTQTVRRKLNPLPEVVRGKRVAVVDDSLVRGTTSKHIVQLLRESGAKEIYFVSAAPPICFPCFYGIDMAISAELIASTNSADQIAKQMGADAMIYQSIDALREIFSEVGICTACFDGNYPVKVSAESLMSIEQDRLASQSQVKGKQKEIASV